MQEADGRLRPLWKWVVVRAGGGAVCEGPVQSREHQGSTDLNPVMTLAAYTTIRCEGHGNRHLKDLLEIRLTKAFRAFFDSRGRNKRITK